ncbi:amidohydrolase [Helicovermis profundi]|uniref:Amidohydrolase n=1 Tax=Helicovermis profundi TaxID=3065157 RepID=A0AAU9EAH4_9FIRM|nr:amidohydrolase [Clostridia bacterium S502]
MSNYDIALINGRIYGKRGMENSFIGIKNGLIKKICDNNMICDYNADSLIDLKGKTIYPGFIDSHMHLLSYSQKKLNEISLNGLTSDDQLISKVKVFIKEKNLKKGEWIIGAGWNQDDFKNRKMIDKTVLDKISKDNPIILTRTCYHICAVNTYVLNLANIDKNTKDIDGGKIDRDKFGNPTGILRENAIGLVSEFLPVLSDKNIMKSLIIEGLKDLKKVGITTVYTDDFSYVSNKKKLWDVYRELSLENKLPINVVLQLRAEDERDVKEYKSLGLYSGKEVKNLIIGKIKLIVDGSLGSRTAALNKPYEDDKENKGILLIEKNNIEKIVSSCFANDFDVTIHAIGDRAIENVLDIYAKHYDIYTKKKYNPEIIHAQITSKEILKKFKKYNVSANLQPIFLNTDWKIAGNRVGEARLKYSYCTKQFLDMGITCFASSDSPIENFNPLYGIYSAVTRKDLDGHPINGWIPSEKISIKEAINLFTINLAKNNKLKNNGDLIKVGLSANLVVLAEDLEKIEDDKIKDVLVNLVIVNGKL